MIELKASGISWTKRKNERKNVSSKRSVSSFRHGGKIAIVSGIPGEKSGVMDTVSLEEGRGGSLTSVRKEETRGKPSPWKKRGHQFLGGEGQKGDIGTK